MIYWIDFLHFFSGVVALDQYIYAVGGYDSTFQLPSVERYDVASNQWEFVSPMSRPRSALSIAVICGKLYAVGQWKKKKKNENSKQIYSIWTGPRWITVKPLI